MWKSIKHCEVVKMLRATTFEIICFEPGNIFTNGRHTTLIQNHALWLGLFVFLIIFAIHFHPISQIKKVPNQSPVLNLCPKLTLAFLFLLLMEIVKIPRENEELDSPQFAESISRDLIWRDGFRIAQLYHTTSLPTTLFQQH